MKATLLILLLLPIVCFSQNRNNAAPSKPSTTACPDFNNKNKPSNKADYYKSLRSMKKVKKDETVLINPSKDQANETKKTEEPQPKKKVEKEQALEKIETKEKESSKKKTKHQPRRNTTKAKKRNASACPNF
jgi:outer membrane biosynthesis protein TonB